jgi:hypothetical protein
LFRRLIIFTLLLVIGYGKYVDWSNIGSKQPSKDALESKPLKLVQLTKESNLSNVDFGEEKYEEFITTLYRFTTHLSPHSHSPLNPFVHNEFPGNFFDHLTGVYKILLAWRQPQYVVRAGLFHSVYGTFDYRYSLYDLREGRSALRSLIGDAAEEISFAICTSDRIGLIRDLVSKMYGSNAKLALDGSKVTLLSTDGAAGSKSDSVVDGNPYPPLVGRLEAEGFSVRYHITQQVHMLSPDLFAQFSIVMVADFMEQGVVALGAADNDICMFRFMRYRFWSDFILYLGDYLREKPAVWAKYLGKSAFIEPTREEVIRMKGLWFELMDTFKAQRKQVIHRVAEFHYSGATAEDKLFVASFIYKYPYIAEPFIFLAATMTITETIQVPTCIYMKVECYSVDLNYSGRFVFNSPTLGSLLLTRACCVWRSGVC